MSTIREIDELLVAAHWRCVQAERSGEDFDAEVARAEQDVLLEQRHALTSAGTTVARTPAR